MRSRARGAKTYQRGRPKRPPYQRVLIVCEGSKTEPNYFEEIRQRFRLSAAHVRVTHGKGTECLQVVETAIKIFKESQTFEKVYAVFDRDDHRTYANAIQKAEAYRSKLKNDERKEVGFEAIASVPCFEVWLLMHFEDVTAWQHRDDIFRKVCSHIPGYEKGASEIFTRTSHLISTAASRAKSGRQRNQRLPGNDIYTDVDELVEMLQSLTPDPTAV